MTRKNKDLTLVVNNQTAEIGNIDTNFYTEDKGIASFRFIFRYDNSYIDLIDSGFVPQLDLFHSDGSIWINQPLIMVMPKRGLVQYSIKDNVIIHAGKVDAKVFLKRGNESIHVANFNFNIIDSGVTGAVEKEISVNLIENTIRNIIEEEGIEVLDENFMDSISGEVITFVTNNPENFKGEKGDKGDKFTFSELTPEQKLELKGDKGDKGDSIQGPQGIQGERGLQGLTGARGPAGADGMDGQDGADGQDGTVTFEEFTEEQIEQLRGPQGPKGDTGEAGLQGPKGDPGLDGTVSFDELTDEQRLTLKGEKGDKGEDGAISFEELSNEQIAMLKGEKGDPGEIPNTETWQKYKLTDDSGRHPLVSLGGNLETLRALAPGYYYTTNTPVPSGSGVSTAGLTHVEVRSDSIAKRITYRPYNSTRAFIMRFYDTWSDWEDVSPGMNPTKVAKNFRNINILNKIPLRFSGYDALVTSSGNTYYYPQGLALDATYLYVLYSPTGSGDQKRLIVVYNRSTSEVVRKFYAGTAGGESIHVETVGSSKYLYVKASASTLGKYDITTLPAEMSTKASMATYNVGLMYNFCKNNNDWIIEQDTPTRMPSTTREVFGIYQNNLSTIKRYFTLDPSVSGFWGTDYNFDTPKRQGIAALDGNLYQVVGGNYYIGNATTPYRNQGVQLISSSGDIAESFTYNPNELASLLTAEGETVTRIEHESAFVYQGKIYALVVYNFEVPNTNGSSHRYCLVEYGAPDAKYTVGENTEIIMSRHSDSYMPPVNGKLKNEYTGANINSMQDLVKYMFHTNRTEVIFYSSDVTINDENGVALAGGITVRVTSAKIGIYWIEYNQNRQSNKVLLTYVDGTNTFTVYNQNVEPAKSGINLNTYLETGNFYVTNSTNGPGGSNHGFVESHHTGTNGQQIFRPYNSATRSFRYYTGGTWSAWTTI